MDPQKCAREMVLGEVEIRGGTELSGLFERLVPIQRDDLREAVWNLLDDGTLELTPDRRLVRRTDFMESNY